VQHPIDSCQTDTGVAGDVDLAGAGGEVVHRQEI
jgi:hypothetical protein